MSDPFSTDLTLTISLNNAKPTLGGDSTSSASIVPIATQKASAGAPPTSQSANQQTPTLQVYQNATNTITWNLQAPTGGTWRFRNLPSTHIIGIVVSNSSSSAGKGGADFEAGTAAQNYAKSLWASKNQIYQSGGLTTQEIKERNPYLLLSPDDTCSLKVKTSKVFIPKSGGGYENLTYNYRLYFYTVGLGVWWEDPSFDVTPTVGSEGYPY